MENLKDLSGELAKLEAKDRWYRVDAEVLRILAPQDNRTKRPYTYKKTGWGRIERVETQEDGTPATLTAPRRRRKTREGEGEIKIGECWSFAKLNGFVVLPWGGARGPFKTGWRRTLDAKGDRYTNPKLDLIKVFPKSIMIQGDIDTMVNGNGPEIVLTPRHVRGKESVRVEEFFDYLEKKNISFLVEVDAENPINEEKFMGLLHSMNSLDSFGPSKRGELRINKVFEVRLDDQEKIRVLAGEDIFAPTVSVPNGKKKKVTQRTQDN